MDYGYDYANSASAGAVAGLTAVYVIFALVVAVIGIIATWKIFAKAGKPGWAAIVPFYNLYVLYEITWGNGILFLLMLIPFVNFIIAIITMVKLAKAFGKDTGFAIGLIFLSFIFMLILAFGSAQYVGVNGEAAVAPAPVYQEPVAYEPPSEDQ